MLGLFSNLRVLVPLMGLLAVGWGATFVIQKIQVNFLKKQIERHVSDIAELKSNVILLRGSLDTQNGRIRVMVNETEQKRRMAEEALRASQRVNSILEARVSDILATPIPEEPIASCLAGDALILETYR